MSFFSALFLGTLLEGNSGAWAFGSGTTRGRLLKKKRSTKNSQDFDSKAVRRHLEKCGKTWVFGCKIGVDTDEKSHLKFAVLVVGKCSYLRACRSHRKETLPLEKNQRLCILCDKNTMK